MDAPSNPSINLATLVLAVQNAVKAINGLNQTVAAVFPPALTSSTTWTPGTIASGSQVTKTLTVVGAVVGSYATASFNQDLQGTFLTAYVSAADTVTAVILNETGGSVTIGAGILSAWVRTH